MILDEFAASLAPADAPLLSAVRDYAAWRSAGQAAEFAPSADDDVAIRTYLTHLRAAGEDREALQGQVAALKCFYAWAQAGRLIEFNPFDEFDLDRPILSREQIRRRHEVFGEDVQSRELSRLRGLVQIAEQLNRSANVQTLLESTLETLARVMDLESAWAFILTGSGLQTSSTGDMPHDFALACARGLPPALEYADRHFLRRPPDCHCQSFFRSGHLTRAVNVVECTRLQNAAFEHHDTQGLLYHATVPLIAQGRPLGLINVATSEWQFLTSADLEFLSAVGAQVAAALERAQLYEAAEAQRDHLERELQVAHQVQASLLPKELPVIPGFQLAADWRSAREVAGDFYDIFPLHDGHWAIVVGDVADKGAPAALYMSMARSLIRRAAPHHHNPANMLMQLNSWLTEESSYDMFVTLFYAILDPSARTLTYANAGHNPPLLRRSSGEIQLLNRTGHVVGAFERLHLGEAQAILEPGDALVIYTDGVTDALDPAGVDYGMERLTAAVRSGPLPAPELLVHLEAGLTSFMQAAPQPDDITFFVITCE